MDLNQILQDLPQIHLQGKTTWRLDDRVTAFLDKNLRPDWTTLETGAGLSTLLFAIKKTSHTCVVPAQDEVDRLREYCANKKISLQNVDFVLDRSERALPALALKPLDLVLIDGRHAFPTPCIDWFYTAPLLKVGGRMLVDDTHLWTGWILSEFLKAEPDWELEKDFAGRAALFVKRETGGENKWWGEQPYVVAQSRSTIRAHRIKLAWQLLKRGKLGTLLTKTFRALQH